MRGIIVPSAVNGLYGAPTYNWFVLFKTLRRRGVSVSWCRIPLTSASRSGRRCPHVDDSHITPADAPRHQIPTVSPAAGFLITSSTSGVGPHGCRSTPHLGAQPTRSPAAS